MNKKTAQLSIAEMRLHIFQRVEDLYKEERMADADCLAKEWICGFNPDNDPSYEFLVEVWHKKVRTTKKTKKYSDLDF